VILVNVYDILLTRSDVAGIVKTKEYLKTQYVTKDKGKPRYLFGIEIAHNKYEVVLSQRKYALDLPYETRLLGYKSVCTPTPIDTDADL